jgi:hypothetical protein
MYKYLHQSGEFGLFSDIYALISVCVKDIGSWGRGNSKLLKSYRTDFKHDIYILAFGGDLKCPRKIHLNTQPKS